MPVSSEEFSKTNVQPAAAIRCFSASHNEEWNNELGQVFVEADGLEQRNSCKQQNFNKTTNYAVSSNSVKVFSHPVNNSAHTLSEVMSFQRKVNTAEEGDSMGHNDASFSTLTDSVCDLNSSSKACLVVPSSPTQYYESTALYRGDKAEATYPDDTMDHSSDLGLYGVNYSCSKSDGYDKVFFTITETEDDEAPSTCTKVDIDESVTLTSHSNICLDQALKKNDKLTQKDICNRKANETIINSSEALVTVCTSDCDDDNNLERIVNQSQVNARIIGGGNESELDWTCPHLQSLID